MIKLFKNQARGFCRIALGLLIFGIVVGCSNAGGSNSVLNNNQPTTGTALTIDSAGVIPVFGVIPTKTVIYVHNHSTTTIGGISYSVVNNQSSDNIGWVDGSQCAVIAAGQSCALKIVTPNLSLEQNQGSMQIKASYLLAKKPYSFNQLVNYALVDVTSHKTAAGVKFKSGANIYGYGHATGYATLYLYASGTNQNYTITDLNANQPSIKFNMNLKDLTLAANSIQAIEVSSPILAASISASLTVKSSLLPSHTSQAANINTTDSPVYGLAEPNSLQATAFSDSVNLAVEPVSAGAILIAGSVPLIDTTTGNVGTITFLNAGNQAAVTGVASADNGLSALSGDCDNQTLPPGTGCTIFFQSTESGGSGSITVPYTGGSNASASGNVTWFNGKGAALVSITIASNPLSFSATVGGRTEVTVTNIGGYTLSNIVIPAPRVVGGSANAEVISGGVSDECVTGGELDVGSSCSYVVEVNDNVTELNQQINLGFSGNYTGINGVANYNRVAPLNYSSTSYGAIIALSSLSPMSISGDGLESVTQDLTISNNGAAAATLTSVGLADNPAYLLANSGDCGASLAAGSSCTLTLKLGPTTSSTESSGTANYMVNYAAVGQTPAGVESASIAWSVSSYVTQPPIITMVTSVTGCASGDGITTTCMDNPTATGGTAGNIQVVLTFTNSSTVTAANTISLPESSSALFTVPGYTLASSSCATGAATNNGSCTIVYNLPSSISESAFQSNLTQADFAYNYTYGPTGNLSGSGSNNLATSIDVVMPTLAIESINKIAQGESGTATINWSNLYQATAPTTTTSATKANGTSATGLSSATPASCGSVASNVASCTSLITTTNSTPVGTGYLLNATAAGGLSATPESFTIFSNNVIFVTASSSFTGDLGGFAGANTKCNSATNKPKDGAPGTGKTYKALLNSNNATVSGTAYYRTDGLTLIATATGGNLVGANSLTNAISTTAAAAWTGAAYNCSNWTSADRTVAGSTGKINVSTSEWWTPNSTLCNNSSRLYCVAQ